MRRITAISLSAVALGSVALAADQSKEIPENKPIRIHNLFADEKGETHFRDIDVEWFSEGPEGRVSKRLPATGIIFRTTPSSYNYDWHTAPRRQYVINLDAAVKITVSDGESRIIGPGEVILVEDTHGKGHVSQAVDGKFRRSVFVTLD
jgi:hypothetical protein